jgi:hypothetical protein
VVPGGAPKDGDESELVRIRTSIARARVSLGLGKISPEAYRAFTTPLEEKRAEIEARRLSQNQPRSGLSSESASE